MLDVLLKKSEKTGSKVTVDTSDTTYRADKPIRSFMKSLSWRIIGTLDTMIISYFITGKLTFAISIGSVEVITKTLLYYFHERAWAQIHRVKFNISAKVDGRKRNIKTAE